MYHIQWEKGDITEKNMMDWLGLKRTTLYKLSKIYKKEIYNNKKKNKIVLDYKLLMMKYIEENKIFKEGFRFYINYNNIKDKFKISSPTILKILKELEKEGKIRKEKVGVWIVGEK